LNNTVQQISVHLNLGCLHPVASVRSGDGVFYIHLCTDIKTPITWSVRLFVTFCISETSNKRVNTKILCFRKENSEEMLILLVHAWVQAQINFSAHSFHQNKSCGGFVTTISTITLTKQPISYTLHINLIEALSFRSNVH
jgi:hypothetical protein